MVVMVEISFCFETYEFEIPIVSISNELLYKTSMFINWFEGNKIVIVALENSDNSNDVLLVCKG